MPHEHMFQWTGYLSIAVNGTDTLFRSPITGKVFKLAGQEGRVAMFPGGVSGENGPDPP